VPPIPPRSCSLQPARGIPSCLSHQLEPSAASACRGREGRKEAIHRSISRIQSNVRKKGLHLPLEIQIVVLPVGPHRAPIYISLQGSHAAAPPRDLDLTRLPASTVPGGGHCFEVALIPYGSLAAARRRRYRKEGGTHCHGTYADVTVPSSPISFPSSERFVCALPSPFSHF
jgi:hypothetical protein